MPHLSELHGAATHLAVVAIPVYALLLLVRLTGHDNDASRGAEPWVAGAAVLGVISAGVTGLLVWGQAQTMLRGHSFRIGTVHFWTGIVIAVLVLIPAVLRYVAHRQGKRHIPGIEGLALAALTVAVVFGQGYLGGRMTYEHGVGVDAMGEGAQTAVGASNLNLALAKGVSPVVAGRQAFSAQGLGCARCHGDRAQGQRGPELAGGRELEEFRNVHQHGLFPPRVVTDRDFAAINAFLKTLPRR